MTTRVLHLDVHGPRGGEIVGNPTVIAWVRALGIDAHLCYSLTVFADGDGTVEAEIYDLDEQGRKYLDPDSPDRPARRTRQVPLTAPIPAAVLALGRC